MKGKKKRILLIILALVLIIIMSIFYINKKDVLVSRVKGIDTKNMNSDNTMYTITLDHNGGKDGIRKNTFVSIKW